MLHLSSLPWMTAARRTEPDLLAGAHSCAPGMHWTEGRGWSRFSPVQRGSPCSTTAQSCTTDTPGPAQREASLSCDIEASGCADRTPTKAPRPLHCLAS